MNGVLFWFSLVITFFFGVVVRAPTKVAEFESCCRKWIHPRSQGLFPLPPSSLGYRPCLRLLTWPPVTETFPLGYSQWIDFVYLIRRERKALAGYRFIKPPTGKYEIHQYYSKIYTSQTTYISLNASVLKYHCDFNQAGRFNTISRIVVLS